MFVTCSVVCDGRDSKWEDSKFGHFFKTIPFFTSERIISGCITILGTAAFRQSNFLLATFVCHVGIFSCLHWTFLYSKNWFVFLKTLSDKLLSLLYEYFYMYLSEHVNNSTKFWSWWWIVISQFRWKLFDLTQRMINSELWRKRKKNKITWMNL